MSTVIRSSLTSAELNQWLTSIDARNEADPGPEHAGEDVLAAGQAAVDVINARRGSAFPPDSTEAEALGVITGPGCPHHPRRSS